MDSVSVGRVDDQLVAIKRADRDTRALLLAEADLLRQLNHPGLVELIDVTETEDGAVMRTAFAGTDTWATRPVDDGVARAAGIAAIAATLADLHGRGVTHRRLLPEHVIHSGDDDRPVLCGLSRSGHDGDEERRADLMALADLIETPPIDSGPAAAALNQLAGRARSGHHEAADIVGLADNIAADGAGKSRPRASLRRITVASAALAAVALLGTVALTGPGRDPVPTEPGNERLEPTAPTRAAPAPAVASTTSRRPSATTGVVLEHAGRRYSVGRAGDIVVLGDWNCDDVTTPAVLRPETGEVARFDEWPEPDQTIATTAGWVIAGARDISVETTAECDQLRIHDGAGSRVLAAPTTN